MCVTDHGQTEGLAKVQMPNKQNLLRSILHREKHDYKIAHDVSMHTSSGESQECVFRLPAWLFAIISHSHLWLHLAFNPQQPSPTIFRNQQLLCTSDAKMRAKNEFVKPFRFGGFGGFAHTNTHKKKEVACSHTWWINCKHVTRDTRDTNVHTTRHRNNKNLSTNFVFFILPFFLFFFLMLFFARCTALPKLRVSAYVIRMTNIAKLLYNVRRVRRQKISARHVQKQKRRLVVSNY